jgi:hypothetical protein
MVLQGREQKHVFCDVPYGVMGLIHSLYSFRFLVLQVHSLFQSELSIEYDIVLLFQIPVTWISQSEWGYSDITSGSFLCVY